MTRATPIALLFFCAGCFGSCSDDIVTRGGNECSVEVGDQREDVLEKCGRPCRTFTKAKGFCKPYRWWEVPNLCSNDCEQYGKAALCYSEDALVHVYDDDDITLIECSW